MKIESDFKDYYDYAIAWTTEGENLVYKRTNTVIALPDSYRVVQAFTISHTPVFCLYRNKLHINPCLKDIHFQQVMDG